LFFFIKLGNILLFERFTFNAFMTPNSDAHTMNIYEHSQWWKSAAVFRWKE